ncbi:glycosyltransferase [Laspinema sp. A4]|uniref:glycosyltransferase family 4 protein n=1 Tax=Laspinema sp. D2d TaxID=2953686 RepID=UPI0021BA9D3A|nr:glycosyltransferase [Laspinema sp. D2d]MCT7985720.1 glycosyltransferase [Laspinema sp. D2d]
MRVLVSSYACRPHVGSEPGVGWNVIQQLVKYHEIWAITREDNRPSIEAELAQNPVKGLHFIYYDFPDWATWWNKNQRGVQFHYYLWQIAAYFLARKLHQEVQFDLIHHVTYVRYWTPSFIALLPIPFIWGPVGGGESAPKSLLGHLNPRGKVYETLRDLARGIGEIDPFVHLSAQRSVIALATTEQTAARLRKLGAKNVQVVGECGMSSDEIEKLHNLPAPSSSPVCFISIGRLLHWKGFDLGLQAFAKAKIEGSQYWLVGDGPEKLRLQTLASQLGIADQVKFWGKLPREETLRRLAESHVLVHPSLHDSGGWVCLEAMATQRPVICLDLGGPGIQVTEETGVKISPDSFDEVIDNLANAFTLLANDPKLRVEMGNQGYRRVNEVYQWDVKGLFLAQLYEKTVNSVSW